MQEHLEPVFCVGVGERVGCAVVRECVAKGGYFVEIVEGRGTY